MAGWAGEPSLDLCAGVWEAEAEPVQGPLLPSAALGSSREASVFSHRRGRELQLEVLILEDAVESRAALGAGKWPVAVSTVLGEFHEESQPRTSSVEPAELVKGLDLLWIQNGF